MWVCSTKWKKFGGKTVFYDELKCEWDMHSAEDLVMCLGHFNAHFIRHNDGFDFGACRAWCRSEEFGRKNVINFLQERNYVCHIHSLRERIRGR